ncbi:MAG: hypothetical protein K6G22_02605 [Lachnospiraceae bacterium]|nr:hypothetical protein [Lachnospiraceae bacterium]
MEDQTSDALIACCGDFTKRSQEEYGLMIHHVEATSRKMSCMGVESSQGGNKSVPTLDVYFRDGSYQNVVDDRGQITGEMSDRLRKLWQETTIPYGMCLNRKDYCDPRMYITAINFDQRCFYDFAVNSQTEISALLKSLLGVQPQRLYTAFEGISIVYSASDYTVLRIEDKAESLRKEMIVMADKYIADKYKEMIVHTSYIRFLHPEMPGYNAYWLWLG